MGVQHHNEHRNSEDIGDVDKLLSEIIGETSLSKDLLLDMFSEDYEREDEDEVVEDAWAGGHHVNHRTHSVPEFANKLISQQQSQKHEGSSQSSILSPTPEHAIKQQSDSLSLFSQTISQPLDQKSVLHKNH